MAGYKSGLLLLRYPFCQLEADPGWAIRAAAQLVQRYLYVHITPQDTAQSMPCTAHLDRFIGALYTSGARHCPALDLRVDLSNLGRRPARPAAFSHGYDVIFNTWPVTDPQRASLLQYLQRWLPSNADTPALVTLGDPQSRDGTEPREDVTVTQFEDVTLTQFDHVVLGGTFDRLHVGHKLLLSRACLLARRSVTIGVTTGDMNKDKTLSELILPVEQRISDLLTLLKDFNPSLTYKLEPITDPYGPSTVDPDLEAIIVSAETERGGHKVNEKRAEKGLSQLAVDLVEVMEDAHRQDEVEEVKFSSSSQRKRMLGELLKLPTMTFDPAAQPYVVGLTGGICSGKSSIVKYLSEQGVAVLDCDKIGHESYLRGTTTFTALVEEFGEDIVGEDGEVNRARLAPALRDPARRQRLQEIVWPAIATLAQKKVQRCYEDGHRVVVLEAALLLEAGWQSFCHEVWVAMVPRDEALRRCQARGMTSQDAQTRLDVQLPNVARLAHAHVTFCSLWDHDVTRKQVDKAWSQLQERIKPPPGTSV